MSSNHADPPLTVRPPAEVLAATKDILDTHGHEIRGFVVACMNALGAEPDAFLAQLAEHWPAPKPRGRPPKAAADGEAK